MDHFSKSMNFDTKLGKSALFLTSVVVRFSGLLIHTEKNLSETELTTKFMINRMENSNKIFKISLNI